MANPVPLHDHILLRINKTLIDEISTESGFKLYLSPEWNFEENVGVEGEVAVLPKGFTGNLSVGEKVCFSYKVVSDRTFPNTSDWFVSIMEPNERVRLWQNSRGEKLRMTAHQGAISIFWTAVFFNSRGQYEPEKSTQGTEEQVERWLHTNFKFGNCENFFYKNLITIDGIDYWKCSYENIFAKKVGDEIVSTGNRVICEIIDIPIPQRIKEIKGIKLPEKSISVRMYDRAVLVSGGDKMGLKKDDIVSFEERYVEKYKLFGKDYFLIKDYRVQGVWEKAA